MPNIRQPEVRQIVGCFQLRIPIFLTDYFNEALSGQRMPDQREEDGKRGQERAKGCKRYADFRGLVLGDQVRGEILETF
jgi:hypothetical protein